MSIGNRFFNCLVNIIITIASMYGLWLLGRVCMFDNITIPSESMHTFLLDEDNNVILVGSPIGNEKIGDMLQDVVKKKLGRMFNISK